MEQKSTTEQSRSKRLAELLVAAMDSYRKYLNCTDVIESPNTKMSLLVWPDVAQSAVWTVIAGMEGRGTSGELDLLERDLHNAIMCPIKGIYDAALSHATYFFSNKMLGIESKAAQAFSCQDVIEQKRILLECINDVFKVLNLGTGKAYPQI